MNSPHPIKDQVAVETVGYYERIDDEEDQGASDGL